jgi:methyltransferase family protein
VFQHWNVIGPLIEAAAPRTIVEIGVRAGATTSLLLEYAGRHDAVVHGIDPAPEPAAEELTGPHARRLVLHRGLSLEVLPQLDTVDCALIDGDHNWYTVLNELRLLGRLMESRKSFPLTFLHDVGWPYGRRDLYYDPETIPSEHRQESRRAGVVPGQAELSDDGGLNRSGCHAVAQGTPRNGVLTAVEDFIAESDVALTLERVIGFSGLGILVSEQELAANEKLREGLAALDSPAFLRDQCRRLEAARNSTRAARRRGAGS